nr:Serine/arginine repetitive matrix protein [Ipomoea batatas]
MDAFFRSLNEDSSPFQQDIIKCPFLRNINEPTNFSFSSSLSFPMPVRGGKGPIFEDGPNFNMAFRLFHGKDGVVPLSGRSFMKNEKTEPEPPPTQFNPLAAKAATISLSAFGPGWPFFGDFSSKGKNKKNSKSDGKSSSQGRNSKHEALSNEWLQSGSCPIAKSYRAMSKVLPLVAKAIQPPPGVHLKCPPAIVAARAAISRTAFAKNLRPQPLPMKVLVIGVMGMAANIPLGIWREHTEKFSPSWFAAVHAAVPFIGMLRKSVLMPKTAMAFTIAASILGQIIGSRAERYRLKELATKNEDLTKSLADVSLSEAAIPSRKSILSGTPNHEPSQVAIVRGHCGETVDWSQQAGGTSSPASVLS